MQAQKRRGYHYGQGQVTDLANLTPSPDIEGDEQEELPEIQLPVKARGQTIGRIRARKPVDAGEWTANEKRLMETLTEQLDVALESARLYQDTQRRAATDRLVSEVSDNMRETLDVDTVLQAAIREMGAALGLSRIEVRMGQLRASAAEGGEHVATD